MENTDIVGQELQVQQLYLWDIPAFPSEYLVLIVGRIDTFKNRSF